MSDPNLVATAASSVILINELMKKKRRKRRWWTSTLYTNRALNTELLYDPSFEDGSKFRNFTRMPEEDFAFILAGIDGVIRKNDTHLREAVSAKCRLAITILTYLCK